MTDKTETAPRLRVTVESIGLHPNERIIEIALADGTTAQSIQWARGIAPDHTINIGWPVASRDDGSFLVELPHETTYGAWRVWVPPEQLVRSEADAHR